MKSGNLRWALIIAGLFFLLGLFRMNDLSIYTDSTRYLIWGHSISEFRGFVDDTQPIPSRFVMNAPLYPVLLAPVQWIFPLSVTAAKIWTLLFAAIALSLFYLWLRRRFGNAIAGSLVLLLALNPLFLIVSTEILSEAPFIALIAGLFLLSDDFFAPSRDTRTRWMFLGCLAILIPLREVGAAFVVASLIVLFLQKRGRDLFLAAAMAGGLFLVWTLRNSIMVGAAEEGQAANVQYLFRHFVTSDQASLFVEFITRAWLNLKGYFVAIGGRILFPFPDNLIVAPSGLYSVLPPLVNAVALPLFLLVLGVASVGANRDLRSGPSGLFRLAGMAAYIVIILFYPVHDMRFFLPLLPLLLFYLALGWESLQARVHRLVVKRALAGTVMVVLVAPNAVAAWEIVRTNSRYTSDPEHFSAMIPSDSQAVRFFDQPWALIGKWVTSHTPDDAVIASPVKEIAPFVYPRKVLETSRVLPSSVFERFLRDYDASYLLTVNSWDSVETFQHQMPESRRLWFENQATTAGIRVYKVHSSILEPPKQRDPVASDTVTSGGLLLEGRRAMLEQRYQNALSWFGKCLEKNPGQPEIVFQMISALSFLGDSAATMKMVEQLYTLPRATAYTQSVQSVVGIMEQASKAGNLTNASAQSFALFETGLAYWGLGYREAARSVMHTVIRLDSTNFVGALWGIYFAKELGDTAESNRFLDRLKKIDAKAQIVGDWEDIRRLGERLRSPAGIHEAVEDYLALARVYAKIELFDEAIDAILRALKLEPSNVNLWLYKGEIFERKKAFRGAASAYRQVLDLEPHNSFARAKLDSLVH